MRTGRDGDMERTKISKGQGRKGTWTGQGNYKEREKDKKTGAESEFGKCGGLVISVLATRSARPGLESRPGASPQSGVRGGRSLCEYCTNKLIKLGPGWL